MLVFLVHGCDERINPQFNSRFLNILELSFHRSLQRRGSRSAVQHISHYAINLLWNDMIQMYNLLYKVLGPRLHPCQVLGEKLGCVGILCTFWSVTAAKALEEKVV